MTSGEAGVLVLRPAVERYPVLPRADVEPAAADLVGGDLVRQDHFGFGVSGEDQPVDPVEQGAVRGVDTIDVMTHGFVHLPIVTPRKQRQAGQRVFSNQWWA